MKIWGEGSNIFSLFLYLARCREKKLNKNGTSCKLASLAQVYQGNREIDFLNKVF